MGSKKQDKTKIVQIWGDILDEGFTTVPNILLRYRKNLNIKPKHLTLIIDIMSFKWDSENPFPSYSTLATRAGMDERSVKRTMQELEELDLLIRTPRFDEESGAQITTVYDFRPLIKKLTKEKNEDKSVIGGVTEMSPGGMTEMSGGGVTKASPEGVTEMSPKKDTYINNNNFSNNPMEKSIEMTEVSQRKTKKNNILRVHKDLRSGIYRNRLFETYDNLNDLVEIEELVKEGALKATKELLINRVSELDIYNERLDPLAISEKVKKLFPYKDLPKNNKNARKFYVAKICDITSQEVIKTITKS